MKKKYIFIFILLVLLSIVIYANNKVMYAKIEGKSKGKVYYEKEEQRFVLFVENDKGRIKEIECPVEPIIINYSDKLVEVKINLGNPNYNSMFINLYDLQVSDVYWGVLAVNQEKEYVVVPNEDSGSIEIYKIFDSKSPLLEIKRDFSPTATIITAIDKVTFTNESTIYISYLKGQDFAETEEIIKITNDNK